VGRIAVRRAKPAGRQEPVLAHQPQLPACY
jgi:hypothetical protein